MLIPSLTRVLLFLPSLTFGFPFAEIFPWGWINTLLHRIRLKPLEMFLFLIFGFILLGSLLINPPLIVLVTFASYLNPLLAFIFAINCNVKTLHRLESILRVLFIGYLVLGILQLFQLLNWLDFVFEFLIPRGGVSTGENGRGVSLLSTEPSRAGIELTFFYATLCLTGCFGGRYREILFDILVLLFILLVIRSFTAVGLFLLYFGIKRPLIMGIVIVLSPLIITWFDTENRSAAIINLIISSSSYYEAFSLLFFESGFRAMSVYSAYLYSFSDFIGMGIGSWKIAALESYLYAGFLPDDLPYFTYEHGGVMVSLKPTAYFALLFLELGAFLGLLITGLVGYIIYNQLAQCRVAILPILGIFLVSVFLVGAVGSPVPWVCLAISIRSLLGSSIVSER